MKDLETIDDDADDVGIQLVKTTDTSVAEELRVAAFPALVYYQGGLPSIYKGLYIFLLSLHHDDDDVSHTNTAPLNHVLPL